MFWLSNIPAGKWNMEFYFKKKKGSADLSGDVELSLISIIGLSRGDAEVCETEEWRENILQSECAKRAARTQSPDSG